MMDVSDSFQYIILAARNCGKGMLIQVKGERYILSTLQTQSWAIEEIAVEYPELESIKRSFKKWMARLDRKYSIDVNSKRFYLDKSDGKELAAESLIWRDKIRDIFKSNGTTLLENYNTSKDLFSEKLLKS